MSFQNTEQIVLAFERCGLKFDSWSRVGLLECKLTTQVGKDLAWEKCLLYADEDEISLSYSAGYDNTTYMTDNVCFEDIRAGVKHIQNLRNELFDWAPNSSQDTRLEDIQHVKEFMEEYKKVPFGKTSTLSKIEILLEEWGWKRTQNTSTMSAYVKWVGKTKLTFEYRTNTSTQYLKMRDKVLGKHAFRGDSLREAQKGMMRYVYSNYMDMLDVAEEYYEDRVSL